MERRSTNNDLVRYSEYSLHGEGNERNGIGESLPNSWNNSNATNSVEDIVEDIKLALRIQNEVINCKLKELSSLCKDSNALTKESAPRKENWFKDAYKGVEMMGVKVILRKRERTILERFCRSRGAKLTIDNIVSSWVVWQQSINTLNDKTRKSTLSSVRSCISSINKALQAAFKFPEHNRPITVDDGLYSFDIDMLRTASKQLTRRVVKPR